MDVAAPRRRRARRLAHVRRRQSLATRRPDAPAQRRRRRAPAQPEASRGRHAARRDRTRSSTSTSNYGHGFHSNDVRGVVRDARGDAAHARHGRGGRRARAPVRALGPRGRALAARPRQRDGVERRRRDDRGRAAPRTARASSSRRASRSRVARRRSATSRSPQSAFSGEPRERRRRSRSRRSRRGRAACRRATRSGPASRARASASSASAIGPPPTTASSWRPASPQFDLHVGYRHRRFDVALDIENLFDGQFRSARSTPSSRLRTEPAIGAPVPPGFTCGANARLAGAAAVARPLLRLRGRRLHARVPLHRAAHRHVLPRLTMKPWLALPPPVRVRRPHDRRRRRRIRRLGHERRRGLVVARRSCRTPSRPAPSRRHTEPRRAATTRTRCSSAAEIVFVVRTRDDARARSRRRRSTSP